MYRPTLWAVALGACVLAATLFYFSAFHTYLLGGKSFPTSIFSAQHLFALRHRDGGLRGRTSA